LQSRLDRGGGRVVVDLAGCLVLEPLLSGYKSNRVRWLGKVAFGFGAICLGCKKRGFFEQGEAEDLQKFVETAVDPQFLFHDCQQHVHADRDPDVGLHGIVGRAIESFDP
jgi:hypothetical protein